LLGVVKTNSHLSLMEIYAYPRTDLVATVVSLNLNTFPILKRSRKVKNGYGFFARGNRDSVYYYYYAEVKEIKDLQVFDSLLTIALSPINFISLDSPDIRLVCILHYENGEIKKIGLDGLKRITYKTDLYNSNPQIIYFISSYLPDELQQTWREP